MSKDIKILIAAKDEASVALRSVALEANNLKASAAGLKAVGVGLDLAGMGSASTILNNINGHFTTMIRLLGQTGIAATAMKAAVVGAVAAAAFKIGEMLSTIGNANKALEESTTKAGQLEKERQTAVDNKRNFELKKGTVLGESQSAKAELKVAKERHDEMQLQAGIVNDLIEANKKLKLTWDDAIGGNKAELAANNTEIAVARERYDKLRQQVVAFNDELKLSELKKQTEEIKQFREAQQAAEDTGKDLVATLNQEVEALRLGANAAQLLQLEREKVPKHYRDEIDLLLRAKDALNDKAEAEKELQSVQEEQMENAKAIREEQAEVDSERRDKIRKAQSGTEKLEGTESRFGIRGHVSAPVDPVHEDNKKLIKLNEENRTLQKEHEKLLQKIANNTKTIDSTVGV